MAYQSKVVKELGTIFFWVEIRNLWNEGIKGTIQELGSNFASHGHKTFANLDIIIVKCSRCGDIVKAKFD